MQVGNQVILFKPLKNEIIEQIREFIEQEKNSFKVINKNNEIDDIKKVFVQNEKELGGGRTNIPQDDDCMIISGYVKFTVEGNKYIVSEDKHFCGYKELIFEKFNILVIIEKECHLVKIID